jgi:N6-adenosine-specific RNA methylase IME4
MEYEILYADPPWDYAGQTQHTDGAFKEGKSAIDHYNTMTLQQLKELNVKGILAKNALLFLWTSSPHLEQSIELMKAWGFEYKTIAFVWEKQKTNPGYYTLSQCEICIVGKKGKIPTPRGTRNERQFLSQLRGKHSEKPLEIRERIVRMFPTQKKIELFAREKSEGWDVFGNEVEDSITLP